MRSVKQTTSRTEESDTSSIPQRSRSLDAQRDHCHKSESQTPENTSTTIQNVRHSDEHNPILNNSNAPPNPDRDLGCARHHVTPTKLKWHSDVACHQCGVSFEGKRESRPSSPTPSLSPSGRKETEGLSSGGGEKVAAHSDPEAYKHWLHMSWLSRLPDE
jgi:hypothetical protein